MTVHSRRLWSIIISIESNTTSKRLGFNNVLNHQIAINIDGRTDDNSHYSPSTKDLTFGTGGVDDAEDAEIISS